jgi:succinate dehydrogenase / fumarate reductase cytochrome b subunit
VIHSIVGKKILMAVTGILMALFLVGHALGNSTFLIGQEAINTYAHHIQSLGPLLWLERLIMLAVLAVHIWMGLSLTLENWKAKPQKYQVKRYVRTEFASRTMIYTGLIILAFLIYHLLHFTIRVTHPDISGLHDAAGRHDVYTLALRSFGQVLVSLIYLVGLAAVLLHLWHGLGSFFQTMGWNSDRTMATTDIGGKIAAAVLFLGFMAIPITLFVLLRINA